LLTHHSALAEYWESTYHTAASTYRTPLDSMELFVLLDLLGSAGPLVPSYFKTTHWAYKHMASVENRLRKLKLLRSSPNHPERMAKRENKKPRAEPQFLYDEHKTSDSFIGGFVQDDHVPFMARGVEILHLIPSPFPMVWHEITDDAEHLDMDTVEDCHCFRCRVDGIGWLFRLQDRRPTRLGSGEVGIVSSLQN
jgi:glutaminyl-peptide cyclotransferase